MHTQTITSDITVVGGGLAGVCAAIAAARLGKRVALVTNRPVLGGNSSSEVRVWVCGATAHGMQRFARETGIMGELYVENQFRNPDGNPVHWDEVILDAVRSEPNISLFLNTDVRRVETRPGGDERSIETVHGWTMGSEIETTFHSTFFIDATGDGLIGELAGAEYRLGREGREEYGESWAPEHPDGQFLGSTILFYTKDAGHPVTFVPPLSTKDLRSTPIPETRIIRAGDRGAHYWWIEWGGELDIVSDNEHIRDELRSVIFGIWDYIKNSGRFDAENLDLEWVGSMPGKREYRRFHGDYTLSQSDILEQTEFPDAVAFGGWSIDLHPVEGMYADTAGAHQRFSRGVYGIPFRSYYSRNVGNLLLAGRDISASHVAFGSSRVMATCAVGGEAAGTGAALALDLGVLPRQIATEHAHELQQLLLRQDASVIGVRNDDPLDHARSATVSASSARRSLDATVPARDEPESRYCLDNDLGVLVPVDPRIDAVRVKIIAGRDTELTVSVWTTGRPQNSVPVTREAAATISVAGTPEAQWVTVPLHWSLNRAHNVVLVFEANPAVEIMLAAAPAPGVLLLEHRPQNDGDVNVSFDEDDLLVRWPALALRGKGPRLELEPPTGAYAPEKAVGGYHRPFEGPQSWVSDDMNGGEQTLTLAFDDSTSVSEVRLVFDDDVDVELNTLHHHRTPHRIFPQLVRDYRIEGFTAGRWRTIATVTGNRRRHRVHRLEESWTVEAVRICVQATNGDPFVRIASIRVY